MINIREIFYSIQGEGIHQGLPTVFIRLQGCNLNPGCTYCDTEYARKEGGTKYTIEEVIAKIVEFSPSTRTRVCITGGEPLLQEEAVGSLVAHLNRFNYFIEVFTNGSFLKPPWWTRVHSWVVDFKAPSSGVCGCTHLTWCDTRMTDQVKLTVGTPKDLEYASGIIAHCATRNPQVVISPIASLLVNTKEQTIEEYWNREWLQEVAAFCLEKNVRFSLQWHKPVWGSREGV